MITLGECSPRLSAYSLFLLSLFLFLLPPIKEVNQASSGKMGGDYEIESERIAWLTRDTFLKEPLFQGFTDISYAELGITDGMRTT